MTPATAPPELVADPFGGPPQPAPAARLVNTGGPAVEYLTVRDLLAGLALAGELASQHQDKSYDTPDDRAKLAAWCYRMSDAMLVARGGR